jgi:hypothetical protein
MLFAGILFDLGPLLIIIAVLVMGVMMIGEMGGEAASKCAEVKWYNVKAQAQCAWAVAKTLAATGGSVAAMMTVGPAIIGILYTISTVMVNLLAAIVFTVWFAMKRVNMWSFTSPRRIMANLLALFIEYAPFLNILPGITIMVWMQIKATEREDKERAKQTAEKLFRAGNRSMRRVMTEPAVLVA